VTVHLRGLQVALQVCRHQPRGASYRRHERPGIETPTGTLCPTSSTRPPAGTRPTPPPRRFRGIRCSVITTTACFSEKEIEVYYYPCPPRKTALLERRGRSTARSLSASYGTPRKYRHVSRHRKTVGGRFELAAAMPHVRDLPLHVHQQHRRGFFDRDATPALLFQRVGDVRSS